jgi:hypothetical protein
MLKIKDFFTKQWVKFILTLVAIPQTMQTYNAWVNNNPWLLTVSLFAIIAIIFLFFAVSSMAKWLKPKSPKIYQGRAIYVPRKGIIFTLGRHSHKAGSPALKALQSQNPEYFGFLGTPETFADNAVKQIAEQAGLNLLRLKETRIIPTDMDAIRIETVKMIEWMIEKGLQRREIVVDITGGMVPMSLAAYIAASEMSVDVQYIASEFDNNNKPIEGKQRALLICMRPMDGKTFEEE